MSEDVSRVSRGLLEHGVTAYCPTVVTSSPEYYKNTLPNIKQTVGGKEGAAVLGIYVVNKNWHFVIIAGYKLVLQNECFDSWNVVRE